MNQRGGHDKKVIVLTGATGVLGRHFIDTYKDRYMIVGVARNIPTNKTTDCDFFEDDITNDSERIISYVLETYGAIDVLINNAVFYDHGSLEKKTKVVFKQELQTNLMAPLILSNTVVDKYWRRVGIEENNSLKRNVVNISSIAGVDIYPGKGSYSVTKAALNMLTKHMALEYKKYGIRVNGVAPNSFPHSTSLESVMGAIEKCIESNASGDIYILDSTKIS